MSVEERAGHADPSRLPAQPQPKYIPPFQALTGAGDIPIRTEFNPQLAAVAEPL